MGNLARITPLVNTMTATNDHLILLSHGETSLRNW
jgi:hypothetical protein